MSPCSTRIAAGFDHVPRQLEHRLLVLVRRVDRDVGVGAGAEVALVLQAEDPGRAGAGDDGDFVQRVLAVRSASMRALADRRVDTSSSTSSR